MTGGGWQRITQRCFPSLDARFMSRASFNFYWLCLPHSPVARHLLCVFSFFYVRSHVPMSTCCRVWQARVDEGQPAERPESTAAVKSKVLAGKPVVVARSRLPVLFDGRMGLSKPRQISLLVYIQSARAKVLDMTGLSPSISPSCSFHSSVWHVSLPLPTPRLVVRIHQ